MARRVVVLGARRGVSVEGTGDRRISTIAGMQRGRVSRRQLLAAGLSRSAITRRRAAGRLIPVGRGVYAVGYIAAAPCTRETEILLGLRDGAWLSHLSGLAFWGVRDLSAGERVHVTVVGSQAATIAGTTVHRVVELRARDCRVRDGLPVTSPSRTLADCGPLLLARDHERAVEEAIRRGLASEIELLAQLTAGTLSGPARARLRALLDGRSQATFTRSEAEEVFLALVRAAALAEPLCNVRRHGYELDFLWPAQRLAVEIDGWWVHNDRASFARDRRKSSDLWQRGQITVVRLTWAEITRDATATIVRIAQMLATASRADGD